MRDVEVREDGRKGGIMLQDAEVINAYGLK
jgi:hypothetical protein